MESQTSPSRTGIRYGIISALIFILYELILMLTGLATNPAMGLVNIILSVVLFVMAHSTFKSANEGFMTYGQGVTIGIVITVIAGTLSNIFTFLYLTFIDDSMIKTAIEKTYDDMVQKGMSDAQIEQAMKMTEKFMTPGTTLIFGLLFAFVFGVVIALIVSAITRKKRPNTAF